MSRFVRSPATTGTSATWVGRVLLCLCAGAGVGWGNPLSDRNSKGNKEYREGRYAEALAAYAQALAEDPGQPDVTYNIGNVLYREGQFEEASQGYGRATFSDDVRRRQEATYNLGNAKYRLGNLEEAAAYYKRALDLNENDDDARYNLEFVLRQMQNQPPQGGEQDQDEESQDQENQEQDKREQQKDEQQQERKEQQQEQEPQESQPSVADSTGTEEPQPQPQPRQTEMTPEEAQRILDALENEEREQRAERKTDIRRTKEVEKDW